MILLTRELLAPRATVPARTPPALEAALMHTQASLAFLSSSFPLSARIALATAFLRIATSPCLDFQET